MSAPEIAVEKPVIQKSTAKLGNLIPLLLLVLAHLPFAVIHYYRTWSLEHYQFFPFAIGMFVWLFHTRRAPELERWGIVSKLLVAADLACLVGAIVIASPWVAVVGLVLLLMAWTLASREQGYPQSLVYLSILMMLTVRLPGEMDTTLINWLQGRTTAFASAICHRIGLLHFSEGNVLSVPGKTFLVAEACSGVKSLFTILFIAGLVICIKRRSALHSLILLACGMGAAGLMNAARVLAVIYVWDRYKFDLSTGFLHDAIGYVSLSIAAGLLMSADAFFDLLTSKIPDVPRPGLAVTYKNPFIYLWNRWLATPEQGPMEPAVAPAMSMPVALFSGGVFLAAVAAQVADVVIRGML